ncbi:MAG: OmpA family protein, partial [Planctomycetaceae bacterium]|nr:OmpA family protein [Planctomycetaceae bacterium]
MNRLRLSMILLVCSITVFQVGCNRMPRRHLRMSQHRAMKLYNENQVLAAESYQYQQSMAGLAAESGQLQQQLAQATSQLDLSNQQLANLNAERSELQGRYKDLLVNSNSNRSPLSDSATKRFQDLANRYPDFEFDPHTGVSKFHSDILFSSGSDRLREAALPLLNDLAEIMNDGDARRLNLLIVGHTDDQPISKSKGNHPTNWHLSTDRADSVVLALSKAGVVDRRLGAAGYSDNQPLVPNTDDQARQRNRRVEIFVLAPDAVVAGWDPH